MAANNTIEHINFTIDGRGFTVTDKHQIASVLLTMAGLPASGYDLAEVKGAGQVKTYKDSQQVIVRQGQEFVSVRQSAQVA